MWKKKVFNKNVVPKPTHVYSIVIEFAIFSLGFFSLLSYFVFLLFCCCWLRKAYKGRVSRETTKRQKTSNKWQIFKCNFPLRRVEKLYTMSQWKSWQTWVRISYLYLTSTCEWLARNRIFCEKRSNIKLVHLSIADENECHDKKFSFAIFRHS